MSREDGSTLGNAMRPMQAPERPNLQAPESPNLQPPLNSQLGLYDLEVRRYAERIDQVAKEAARSLTATQLKCDEARRKTEAMRLSLGEASRLAWSRVSPQLIRACKRVARMYATIRATTGFGNPEDIELVLRARLPALDVRLYRNMENPTRFDVVFTRGDKVFVAIAESSELKDVNTLAMRVIKMAYGPEFAAGPKGA